MFPEEAMASKILHDHKKLLFVAWSSSRVSARAQIAMSELRSWLGK